MNILIVDKDRAAGRAALTKLVFEGHDVHGPVASASEAFDIASEFDLDVAILDIKLRDGMSGAALATSLMNNGVPVIITTRAVPASTASELAAHSLIRKPYTVMDLVRAVRAVCGQGDAEQGSRRSARALARRRLH
jgi:DNA-binding response OmpR family regulator